MITIDTGLNDVYVYSKNSSLINWNLKLMTKQIRDKIEIDIPMTVDFFGNSFYKLTFTPPVLDSKEYDFEITSGTELIDKGILRNGTI
jgi:hypothetical protein